MHTVRHPNLFAKALTTGPEVENESKMLHTKMSQKCHILRTISTKTSWMPLVIHIHKKPKLRLRCRGWTALKDGLSLYESTGFFQGTLIVADLKLIKQSWLH
jgi:hypothetical protein